MGKKPPWVVLKHNRFVILQFFNFIINFFILFFFFFLINFLLWCIRFECLLKEKISEFKYNIIMTSETLRKCCIKICILIDPKMIHLIDVFVSFEFRKIRQLKVLIVFGFRLMILVLKALWLIFIFIFIQHHRVSHKTTWVNIIDIKSIYFINP